METLGDYIFWDKNFVVASDINRILPHFNSVYEILRIQDSVPVFLQSHYERFLSSCNTFEVDIIDYKELNNIIKELIERNNIAVSNLRFEYRFYTNNVNLLVAQIPFSYPEPQHYQKGVKLLSSSIERPNPHVKQSVINDKIRRNIADILSKEDIYEVALVNHDGEITEGSRSNIFFTKENKIISASSELILEGITRKRIVGLLKEMKTPFIEAQILLSEIEQYDACFLTGTSPKVLPVAQINDVKFDPNNKLVKNLMEKYNSDIETYCKTFLWP